MRREQSIMAQKVQRPLRRPVWLPIGIAAAFLLSLVGAYFVPKQLQKEGQQQASAHLPPTPTGPSSVLKPLAFVLMPANRSSQALPRLGLPGGADEVSFRLQLELDEFPLYRAALTDLASGQIVWRSDPIKSSSNGKDREVTVRLPARVLGAGDFALDVSGFESKGAPELIGSYPFKVVTTLNQSSK